MNDERTSKKPPWCSGKATCLVNQGLRDATIFQDKLLTRTYCDEAGDYAVPNDECSPRDLVFRPDLSDINCTIIIINDEGHANNCWHCNIYEQNKFHAHLS